METQKSKVIGIVGGGASGILCALELFKALGNKVKIQIFDPCSEEDLGRGLAYKKTNSDYYLNVPASKMSLDPSDPQGFEKFLTQYHPEELQGPMAPFAKRNTYGEYIQHQLQKARELGICLEHIREKVVKSHLRFFGWKLQTESRLYHVDNVIFAHGYSGIRVPPELEGVSPSSIVSVFDVNQMTSLDNQDVLVVGTGLSSLDFFHDRQMRKEKGKTFFLSRHGVFPWVHDLKAQPYPIGILRGWTPLQIFSHVRRLHKVLEPQGQATGIYLALRSQAPEIWSTWTLREKAQFDRHLEPLWRVLRHRAPAPILKELSDHRNQKNVEVLKGKICKIETSANGEAPVKVVYRERDTDLEKILLVDRIVLATGPIQESQPRVPLWDRSTDLPGLYKIGPAAKTFLNETMAIPEIRQQVQATVARIKSELKKPSIFQIFTLHPSLQRETYGMHFQQSKSFGIILLKMSRDAFLHALMPFLKSESVSRQTRDFSIRLSQRRTRTLKGL